MSKKGSKAIIVIAVVLIAGCALYFGEQYYAYRQIVPIITEQYEQIQAESEEFQKRYNEESEKIEEKKEEIAEGQEYVMDLFSEVISGNVKLDIPEPSYDDIDFQSMYDQVESLMNGTGN